MAPSSPSNPSAYTHRSQGDNSCDTGVSQEGVRCGQEGWVKGLNQGVWSSSWLWDSGLTAYGGKMSSASCSPLPCPSSCQSHSSYPGSSGNVCPARPNRGLWGKHWGRSGDVRQTSSVKMLQVLIRGGRCMPLPRGIGSHLCSIYRTQAPEFPGVAVLLSSVLQFWTQFITRC